MPDHALLTVLQRVVGAVALIMYKKQTAVDPAAQEDLKPMPQFAAGSLLH
jgi:hypothetical protein